MDLRGNRDFTLKDVALRDSYLLNAFEKEVQYLLSLDTDRLLAGYRETSGVSMRRGAVRYGGWESMLIGGHTLGHYMSACVKACESANCGEDNRLKFLAVIRSLIDGLCECQEVSGSGFLFGAQIIDRTKPEQQFDLVEQNQTDIMTQAWVPWYTMHKTIEGLVSVCEMENVCDAVEPIREKALTVLTRLGDWVYGRTSSWSEETHRIVLGIEYGGMNDCMYDVYLLTKDAKHLAAALAFDETELFEKVFRAKPGENVLNNHHANTTIPKFMGALKRFVVTGEERFYHYAAKFWELVTNHHTYVTGGNSEWEHFGEDDVLDKERTNCNCETCNAYNMLKMTKLFFMISGEAKYADWYEKTLLNSIIASQNPQTGMTTYFQPMASGYHKVYGEPFTKFWCCMGTGMENFTKLQESFYFYKENCLIVNQYFSSSVLFGGAEFVLDADLLQSETITMEIKGKFDGEILFRLPGWLAENGELRINGEVYSYEPVANGDYVQVKGSFEDGGCARVKGPFEDGGYARVKGPFEDGCRITLRLPMQVQAHALPDARNTYAFTYGPMVLSALLGKNALQEGKTGVDVTISAERKFPSSYIPSESEEIRLSEGTVESFIANIPEKLVRTADGSGFVLQGTDASLIFVPHFSQHEERYGIYFKFADADGGQFI